MMNKEITYFHNGALLSFNQTNTLTRNKKYLTFYYNKINSIQIGTYVKSEYNNKFWKNMTIIIDPEGHRHCYSFPEGKEYKDNYNYSRYELISSKEKAQNAMELRAINLIIQNIIGDNLFTYL